MEVEKREQREREVKRKRTIANKKYYEKNKTKIFEIQKKYNKTDKKKEYWKKFYDLKGKDYAKKYYLYKKEVKQFFNISV